MKKWIGNFDPCLISGDDTDFLAKYQGCYLFVKTPCGYKLSILDRKNIDLKYELRTCDGILLKISPISEYEIACKFPPKGFFYSDSRKEAFFVSRIPERQWKKAPHAGNTSIVGISSSLSGYANNELFFDLLKDCYSFVESKCIINSINFLQKNQKVSSHAVNRKVAISKTLNLDEDSYYIWFNNVPVGIVFPTTSTIKLHNKAITQEFYDMVNRGDIEKWTFV